MHSSRRRGPRGDISADLLLAAAERVLDAGGLLRLSVRAVAQEAEVTPNVVYTYFTDMADLRHQLGDRFLGRLDLGLLTALPAEQSLRQFLRHVLQLFADAPGQVQILASQRILGRNALGLNEALLTYFIDSVGHSPRAAAAATDLVTEWVHGTVLLAASDLPLPDGISLAGYPRTAAMLTGTAAGTGPDSDSAKPPEGDAAALTALDLVVRAVTESPE